jgi:hypothetical protein
MSLQSNSGAKRPTILAGAGTSPFGSLGRTLRAAETLQFFAVDLDLRQAWLMPSATSLGRAGDQGIVRIRSAWIPGSITGPRHDARTAGLWSGLVHAATHLGLRTVIVPHRAEVIRGDWLGSESRRVFRESNLGLVRHAIGIRGAAIQRGHEQLRQLQMLRHTAEEWDLDLALDLTGDVPHYLEAEAAILRLISRLTVVRIPSWVSANGELNTADPISRRVISILADQGYAGTISIVPMRSPWNISWHPPAPTSSEEWTRAMILDQYTRQRSDDAPASYISPEIFREFP